MSDNSKKEKVSFRVEWNFEAGSEEAIAIEYINQLGAKKKSEVINALKLFFYPKAAYSGGIEANEVQLRLCRDLIIQLEQQALYLRRLLDLPGNAVRNACEPEETRTLRASQLPLTPTPPFLDGEEASSESTVAAPHVYTPPTSGVAGVLSEIIGESDDWDEEEEEPEEEDYGNLFNPYEDGI